MPKLRLPLPPAALAAARSWHTPPQPQPLPPRPPWQQAWHRVAVVGGAEVEPAAVERALNRLHARQAIGLLITVDGPGVGQPVRVWGRRQAVATATLFSNRERDGVHAPQIRDATLLHALTPHLIVDFAGGPLTAWLLANAARHYNITVKHFA